METLRSDLEVVPNAKKKVYNVRKILTNRILCTYVLESMTWTILTASLINSNSCEDIAIEVRTNNVLANLRIFVVRPPQVEKLQDAEKFIKNLQIWPMYLFLIQVEEILALR